VATETASLSELGGPFPHRKRPAASPLVLLCGSANSSMGAYITTSSWARGPQAVG